ncbi:SRPBCC domain-containing protein [Jatrophihabitans telluris]|uniref:SRPBCC domain-containing protein n=1 Tax=Jatrophihabitans telluris TaxID=2038343 RepID=A0ABY4QZJ9_9ACTN|nr:SRPBCC domain-containing protein [Jatrophihabitans telluris]UQX88652.1 SRPBCC domain-containing protein [Jatrophihabitans telluris]
MAESLVDGALRDARDGTFACHTTASPEHVWRALTDPSLTPRYLYGLVLTSEWTAGAPIKARHCDERYSDLITLSGRVLCARPGDRLSYQLQCAEDPPVYLTWQIRACRLSQGTVCSLQVDEVESLDSRSEAEDTWLPVLAALQHVLDN